MTPPAFAGARCHARRAAAPLLCLAAACASIPGGSAARTANADVTPPLDSITVAGVSHALAATRAASIGDVRYDLRLDLTGRDTARGHAAVRFNLHQAGPVVLDFRGPTLADVHVNGRHIGEVDRRNGHLVLPAGAVRRGENLVEADFAALIAPSGASIIRFHDETDGADYLYTLLVPSDANALFPCFDQPDLKARVTLSLTVPGGWTAIGNGITERVDSSGTARSYRFRQTEPLPTYLVAFAAGPWTRFVGGPRNTALYVRASRAREVEVDSLQTQVASALNSLERYFGIPYPFQQFQYLLAPAFPFGGMEHPGVTMFNEEAFVYREPPTLTQRLGRRATIYHEVAHQWFGDYVTMRWFDDLWLKEGFATYMAAKMQELEGLPDPWLSFYQRNKPLAYATDATAGTTPIWQDLANLDQAKSNYGAIVYNKAPSVLKQLNYLVGDSAFQVGVRRFLAGHPYGNATWQELLEAIGGAAGRPLDQWGTQWILRPGMPVLEQHVDTAGGRIASLTLVQHPAQAISGAGNWPLRTEVLLARAGAEPVRIPVEITAETTVVAAAAGMPAPDYVYANSRDYAYALVVLDPASTVWLEQHIGDVQDTQMRAMLWGSLWDLVRDARLDPRRFVAAALRELPREPDEQIAGSLIGRLGRATSTYITGGDADAFRAQVESALLAGVMDTTRGYGFRKSHLDAYIDLARSPEAVTRIDRWLDDSTVAGLPLRQPSRWSIVTTLLERSAPTAEVRFVAESRRDSTPGGKRMAFVARAGVPTAATKANYFRRYFADSTLNEEWVTASLRAFHAADQSSLTFPYLIPSLDSLPWIQRNRRIFFLGSWLGAVMGGQRSAAALAATDAWLAAHPTLAPDLRRKVLQARDDLERVVRIQAAFPGS